MKVKMGCDIVEIKRFSTLGKDALEKMFHPTELKNLKPQSLAGIFALKESCKKVFNDLTWHDIEVRKKKNGKPGLILHSEKNIDHYDCSISHDGDYAMAMVVFVVDEDTK